MVKIPLATASKIVFTVLGLVMFAVVLYAFFNDGFPFPRKLLAQPWMGAALVDFMIIYVAFTVWIAYKESNWVSTIPWIVFLFFFGSAITSAYIVVQFLKLSSQESSQNPIYYVLLRLPNKNGAAPKREHSSVVTLRILFGILGVVMVGTLVYTLVTEGPPFRIELLTPWLTATLIDIYFHDVILAVWVAYKESSWISAIFWIILLICLGSIAVCFYLVWQLFKISSHDPSYLVLVRHGDRK